MRLDELRQPASFCEDYVVGQDDCEGLVTNEARSAGHGVAEAEGLVLADVGNFAARHSRAVYGLERLSLARGLEARLELGGGVEVVAER